MTVAFVSERKQFGVRAGSFQAVSHRCEQMLLDTEGARSAAFYAASAAPERLAEACGLACAAAAEAGVEVTVRRSRRRAESASRRRPTCTGCSSARQQLHAALLGSGSRHRMALARAVAACCGSCARPALSETVGPYEWRTGDARRIAMSRRCIVALLHGALLAAGVLGAGAASAAPPTFERIDVDDTFADEFLTETCGVDVTTTVRGHVILRTFSGDRTGPAQLNTLNLAITATAEGRTFRFRDVGADLTRIEPDGTAVLSIIGQVPFDFAGVLKIDLETGDAILEPKDRSAEQLAKACRVLTGG
jgi:Acyl-CoA dehydrogenase, C-terminal domain